LSQGQRLTRTLHHVAQLGSLVRAQYAVRYFRVTKRNEQTDEARVDIIGATRVPRLATYEVNKGWSIVSPIEELDGPPPLTDDAVEGLKRVFADHLKRKHGVKFEVTMKQKGCKPRVIAKDDVPTRQPSTRAGLGVFV
jgi:hypothetical protein